MAQAPGVPSYELNRVNAAHERLINGHEIQIAGEIHTIAPDQVIEYKQAVTLNEDDLLVPATAGTPAIGICMASVQTDSETPKTVEVLVAGVLNPNAVVWDASYVNLAQKLAAFRGAPAPTNIIVKASV